MCSYLKYSLQKNLIRLITGNNILKSDRWGKWHRANKTTNKLPTFQLCPSVWLVRISIFIFLFFVFFVFFFVTKEEIGVESGNLGLGLRREHYQHMYLYVRVHRYMNLSLFFSIFLYFAFFPYVFFFGVIQNLF